MLTVSQILEHASSYIADDSATTQAKMLIWLNAELQKLAKMRTWRFLSSTATVTLTDGSGPWPIDFGSMESIAYQSTCLYPSDRLSDRATVQQKYLARFGFTQDATGFTVYPSTDEVVLNYQMNVPNYAVGDTTLFPERMLSIISRGILNAYYEFDMDERAPSSFQIYSVELKEAKKWDNSLKGMPRRTNNITWDNV